MLGCGGAYRAGFAGPCTGRWGLGTRQRQGTEGPLGQARWAREGIRGMGDQLCCGVQSPHREPLLQLSSHVRALGVSRRPLISPLALADPLSGRMADVRSGSADPGPRGGAGAGAGEQGREQDEQDEEEDDEHHGRPTGRSWVSRGWGHIACNRSAVWVLQLCPCMGLAREQGNLQARALHWTQEGALQRCPCMVGSCTIGGLG